MTNTNNYEALTKSISTIEDERKNNLEFNVELRKAVKAIEKVSKLGIGGESSKALISEMNTAIINTEKLIKLQDKELASKRKAVKYLKYAQDILDGKDPEAGTKKPVKKAKDKGEVETKPIEVKKAKGKK